MSTTFGLVPTAARIAVALAFVLPAVSTAVAQSTEQQQQEIYHTGENDAFGAQHDYSLQAARSARSPAPLTAEQRGMLESEYRTGQENSFDAGLTTRPVVAQRDYQARLASTVPMVGGARDLIGQHGAQDALANQIYQPGSRPAGW